MTNNFHQYVRQLEILCLLLFFCLTGGLGVASDTVEESLEPSILLLGSQNRVTIHNMTAFVHNLLQSPACHFMDIIREGARKLPLQFSYNGGVAD